LTWRVGAALAVLVLLLVGGAFYTARRLSAPPKRHDPLSVLIADFENTTNDRTLDHTLEPVMKLALEGAGFISAYDRTGLRSLGARAGDKFDERAATEIAAKQAVGVVVTGKVERRGSGFGVSVKAAQTVTGAVLAQETARAADKEKLPEVATQLAATVRNALGDDTATDSAQMFAMASLSATSLDVLRHYAAAREASSNGNFEDALRSYGKTVELDPKFGIGYQGLATVSLNLGKLQDADKYFKEALSHLDGMTERERYNTRGVYYRLTGDFQQCEKEYTDLIARFDGDVLAHNNLALCSAFLRNMPKALKEMRRAVAILPKRALFRINLSLYSSYGGDFQTGEQEARAAQELASPLSLLPLAFAQAGQERLADAAESYRSLGKVESLGPAAASWEASGLADLAIYEGRFSEAVRILEAGAAADVAAKNADRAAAKLVAVAYAQLSRGRKPAAIAAAERALATSQAVKIRFLAGRILIESGQVARGRTIAAGLASELQVDPQAHAKILDGLAAFRSGTRAQGIKSLSDATTILNTWIGHFDLGRAYFEAGQYPQADSEFDRCITRRGEALSLFLDEEPTFGYLPAAYYYQGRVREELKGAGSAESYNTYLEMRGNSPEDPLVPEVRQRVAARPANP
jgi:tetratricopeptide (TPR) repeat protein